LYSSSPDCSWLYTGDVIQLRLINLRSEPYILIATSQHEEHSVRQIIKNEFCVFLSHECDMNDSNFFLLSALHLVPPSILRDDFDRFVSANEVNMEPHYLSQFYYAPYGQLWGHMWLDITRIQYVSSKNTLNRLLMCKRAQLTDHTRILLKKKLAYYFLRQEQPRKK
jgi:hypothetical protein